MKLNLKELIQSLDNELKVEVEGSAKRCVNRGGNEILIEDLLFSMLSNENSIIYKVLNHFNIDINEMKGIIQKSTKIQITESNSPVFSRLLIDLFEDAYLISKVKLNKSLTSSGSLIISLFDNNIKYSNTKYFRLLKDIDIDDLMAFILEFEKKDIKKNKKLSELDKYTINLTNLARKGEIDPVLCREEEIKQAIDILSRRRKNNPIIVGEAGVGKTAVVEGLALKIINRQVPNHLYKAQILSLDLSSLQAGAGVKGEFERRLQTIIKEIKESKEYIILFIDEAHTLIGAGGNEGGSDAANLLKPALARGQLRTIAATTWNEYRKYFEKDSALARRFQKIDLLEPTVNQTVTILHGLAKKYEKVHNVYIENEALEFVSYASARYITGRQLPDKAIDVLDTACANVKISQSNEPFVLQKLSVLIEEIKIKIESLERDNKLKVKDYSKEIKLLYKNLEKYKTEYNNIHSDWLRQKEALAELNVLIKNNEVEKIEEQNSKIKKLQESNEYISKNVTKEQIAEIISSWTGIPLGNMMKEQIQNLSQLESNLKERIIGQNSAMEKLNDYLQISTAGLQREDAPLGVFLLVGPSGVGKTETANSISDLIYGGNKFITTINMTEFQEKHTISKLIGSPPGYVGYGEGGQLTDAIRLKPYSVILLDEIEKAHPDVLHLFYQVFDKGILNDGEGREINFRNTIIIMTSNLAENEISELCRSNHRIKSEDILESINKTLTLTLESAFLGRVNVVPYKTLDDKSLEKIVKLKLDFTKKLLEKKKIQFSFDEKLLKYIISESNAINTGARNIELTINTNIVPKISKKILDATVEDKNIKSIRLVIDKNEKLTIRCTYHKK
jgi:type VI secretion system protein VasG